MEFGSSRTGLVDSCKGLRLAVVGVGALGSELCRRLAAAPQPPASVLLIDPDMLQPHNVPLSRLFTDIVANQGPACLHRAKTELIVSWFEKKIAGRSAGAWSAVMAEIADVGWGMLSKVDLLISCADNALARLETAFAARSLGLPMLDGGVLGAPHAAGRVAWFPPAADAACYGCGLREDRRAELLAYASAPSLGCHPLSQAEPMGAHAQVPAAVDSTAEVMMGHVTHALEHGSAALAEQLGAESWADRLALDSDGHWTLKRIALPRSETCPWHVEARGRLVALWDDLPLRSCLPTEAAGTSAWRLQLGWPVCVRARCRVCGQVQDTVQRLAALRHKGVCVGCGVAAQLDPLRCVTALGPRDAELDCTPRQLGLPARHLLVFRPALLPGGGEQVI